MDRLDLVFVHNVRSETHISSSKRAQANPSQHDLVQEEFRNRRVSRMQVAMCSPSRRAVGWLECTGSTVVKHGRGLESGAEFGCHLAGAWVPVLHGAAENAGCPALGYFGEGEIKHSGYQPATYLGESPG